MDTLANPQSPSDAWAALLQGGLLMAGLIVAIGAQNALVLRQGLERRHVGAVVALCAASDAVLIAAGVFGLGAALARSDVLMQALRYGGAAFLLIYGLRSARRAWVGEAATLQPVAAAGGLAATLSTTLALTFLNPHVYLDTLLLVGSVGAQQAPGMARATFAAGAAAASLLWFVMLGYGASAFAPWLRRPAVWRGLDAGIAVLMIWLALQLGLQPLSTRVS